MRTPRLFTIPIAIALLQLPAWSASSVNDTTDDIGKLEAAQVEKLEAEAKAMLKAADKHDNDPHLRAKVHARDINRIFEPIFQELKLPANTRERIKEALLERQATIDKSLQHRADRKIDNSAFKLAKKKATETTLSRTRQLLSDDLHAKLSEMLDADVYLSNVTTGYAPLMALLKCPMNADQQIRLATVLRSVYDSSINPQSISRSSLPVNNLGLTEIDEAALKEMEVFLNADQVQAMRISFISTNWREDGR